MTHPIGRDYVTPAEAKVWQLEQRVAVLEAAQFKLTGIIATYHSTSHSAAFPECAAFVCRSARAALAPQPQEVEP